MHRNFNVYGDSVALPEGVRIPAATPSGLEISDPITFNEVDTLSNSETFDSLSSSLFSFSPSGKDVDLVGWNPYCNFQLDYSARSARYTLNGPLGMEAFEDYYLSQVLSFFFIRENREPLHASVVTNGNSAIALLGDSGTGKSSMVAAFLGLGWRLVTDDLAMVDVGSDSCRVHPGIPRLKLFPDVAERYYSEKVIADSVRRLSTKLICDLDRDAYHAAPVALDCCVVLQRTSHQLPEMATVTKCSRMEALFTLLKNTYNTVNIDKQRERTQFVFFSRLANSIPVLKLDYQSDLDALDAVAARLARYIRRH